MNVQILLRLLPRVLCLSKLISVEEYERIRNLPFPNAKINACFDCWSDAVSLSRRGLPHAVQFNRHFQHIVLQHFAGLQKTNAGVIPCKLLLLLLTTPGGCVVDFDSVSFLSAFLEHSHFSMSSTIPTLAPRRWRSCAGAHRRPGDAPRRRIVTGPPKNISNCSKPIFWFCVSQLLTFFSDVVFVFIASNFWTSVVFVFSN